MSLFRNKNVKREPVIKLDSTVDQQPTTPTDASKVWIDTSVQ